MSHKTVPYKDKFGQLQSQLLAAYATFYVWRALQKEEYNKIFQTNNNFWSVVMPALQDEWFIGLARLFEDSSYSKNGTVISVYSLILEHPNKNRGEKANEFLISNKRVINNIARIRDHQHAHNNVNFLVNRKQFETRFSIKYNEIEGMFEFADKMLGILHPEDDHGFSLDHLREDAQRDTEDVVVGLRYYDRKRAEYRAEWIKGSRSSYQFPPKE